MSTLETWLLTYLLNSLWQLPLVFAAAWFAARFMRRSGPGIEHRIWVTALALEALLPACSVSASKLFDSLSRMLSFSLFRRGEPTQAHITITSGPAYAHAQLHLPPHLLAVIALVYACTVAFFAARLISGLRKTRALHRDAQRITLTGPAADTWTRCCNLFAVQDAELATSREIACPMTLGIRRRVVLLPADVPSTLHINDLDAALAHEFAHMHRRDFAKNLVYAVLSLPIAWHPLLWLTRTRLEETREMVCDAMAAEAVASSQSYARSLLRLASLFAHRAPDPTLHAIGIFDANVFERRIMNLTNTRTELRGLRRFATVAACVTLGLGTCASALALRMNVAAPTLSNANQQAPQSTSAAHVSGGVIAGNRLSFVDPIYPPKARAAKRDGTVILNARIGKDGKIDRLRVASGPAEFRQSALDAVKQWRYKPFLFKGEPTTVDTTISVRYQIF